MPSPAVQLESLETFCFGLDHPEGICLAPDGHLYVGGEAGQIYRIEDDAPVELVSTGGFMLGLAADADSRIYAIDSAARCVWRIDPHARDRQVWADGSDNGGFHTPNWGVFDSAGNYYLSDSGDWGAGNGRIWRVQAGGRAELWTQDVKNFPNGLALAEDGSRLYVLESVPGALVEVEIRPDGTAGERVVLCDLDPAVPDGVALGRDGGFYLACYRPDAVLRWHPEDGLSVVAEDPRGTVLAAPTNIAFGGPNQDEMVVPNIGRWHLTRIRAGVQGVPLNYPTRIQLGS